ncbi:MAG: GtrA family protein [Muribaculaceae bacterium]|nr:GtrA family protein [Muribaculaceae bacterium]
MNIKQMINGNGRISEILRFGLVGGIATVLQYGFYVIFVHAVFGGRRAVVASIISYALSFIANFFLSSYFTFHTRPNARKGLGFTLSHLVNMGLQTGLVAIFKEIIGPTLALLPAMGICIPVNYFLVRFAFTSKVFGNKRETEATQEPTDSSPTLLQDEESLFE